MAKPTVIVDTNVLIAAMLGSRTARRALRAIVTMRCPWYISPELIQELIDVPRRPKFNGVITTELTHGMLRRLRRHARLIEPTTSVQACRDPRDNHVLAAALDSHATVLITGDRDLLVMTPFRNVAVTTPTEFLTQLQIP